MARIKRRTSGSRLITWETVRELARVLPGVQEGISYGTPAFRVCGKLFVRFHQSGECIVVRMEPEERAMRLQADPKAFFITDHYHNYPWMLVRLSAVRRDDLRDLVEESWRKCAPKRLLAVHDAGYRGQT